eukprot:gene25675-11342_t
MLQPRGCILTILLSVVAVASVSAKSYKAGDEIPLYANKVGPFSNPTETYRYFSLSFCQPKDGASDKLEDLGEVLEGDRLVSTPYLVKFRTDLDNKMLCDKKLSTADLKQLRDAVNQDYYFQMYFDDLPVWGFIGKVEKIVKTGQRKFFLFTHFHFEISYNSDKVIEINVSSDPMPTEITYDHRMDRYSRYSFLPQHLEIHWFSIINSMCHSAPAHRIPGHSFLPPINPPPGYPFPSPPSSPPPPHRSIGSPYSNHVSLCSCSRDSWPVIPPTH